ncbi:hypothetical protein NGM37_36350 [Streptomyces sp. TRM76130]|nr:hypothetical protein [Streptomyces sp. TRM76130]
MGINGDFDAFTAFLTAVTALMPVQGDSRFRYALFSVHSSPNSLSTKARDPQGVSA